MIAQSRLAAVLSMSVLCAGLAAAPAAFAGQAGTGAKSSTKESTVKSNVHRSKATHAFGIHKPVHKAF